MAHHTIRLTSTQERILAAIEQGHHTYRALVEATGISSTSVVAYNVRRLAERGILVLEERGGKTLQIYDARDFCAAWDAAAALAGNPAAANTGGIR